MLERGLPSDSLIGASQSILVYALMLLVLLLVVLRTYFKVVVALN